MEEHKSGLIPQNSGYKSYGAMQTPGGLGDSGGLTQNMPRQHKDKHTNSGFEALGAALFLQPGASSPAYEKVAKPEATSVSLLKKTVHSQQQEIKKLETERGALNEHLLKSQHIIEELQKAEKGHDKVAEMEKMLRLQNQQLDISTAEREMLQRQIQDKEDLYQQARADAACLREQLQSKNADDTETIQRLFKLEADKRQQNFIIETLQAQVEALSKSKAELSRHFEPTVARLSQESCEQKAQNRALQTRVTELEKQLKIETQKRTLMQTDLTSQLENIRDAGKIQKERLEQDVANMREKAAAAQHAEYEARTELVSKQAMIEGLKSSVLECQDKITSQERVINFYKTEFTQRVQQCITMLQSDFSEMLDSCTSLQLRILHELQETACEERTLEVQLSKIKQLLCDLRHERQLIMEARTDAETKAAMTDLLRKQLEEKTAWIARLEEGFSTPKQHQTADQQLLAELQQCYEERFAKLTGAATQEADDFSLKAGEIQNTLSAMAGENTELSNEIERLRVIVKKLLQDDAQLKGLVEDSACTIRHELTEHNVYQTELSHKLSSYTAFIVEQISRAHALERTIDSVQIHPTQREMGVMAPSEQSSLQRQAAQLAELISRGPELPKPPEMTRTCNFVFPLLCDQFSQACVIKSQLHELRSALGSFSVVMEEAFAHIREAFSTRFPIYKKTPFPLELKLEDKVGFDQFQRLIDKLDATEQKVLLLGQQKSQKDYQMHATLETLQCEVESMAQHIRGLTERAHELENENSQLAADARYLQEDNLKVLEKKASLTRENRDLRRRLGQPAVQ